jgi:protein-L-isoaspartate(D-aspartate) O-methyltransferase
MGQRIDFLAKYQSATKRDYVARVVEHDKAECAVVAKRWGEEYWDGPRQYGYGGYRYDGRWLPIAQEIAERYNLQPGGKVLDVGCGKAFLLYEFTRAVPGIEIAGLDISAYGIANAKEEARPFLREGNCTKLPYPDESFDFVYSINTFHNIKVDELKAAVQEVERVGKGKKWICVESYRDEREKANLLYWQLTCMSFYTPEEWAWLYREWGYTGDYGFIFFE